MFSIRPLFILFAFLTSQSGFLFPNAHAQPNPPAIRIGAIGSITISSLGSYKMGVSMFQIKNGRFERLHGVDTQSADIPQ